MYDVVNVDEKWFNLYKTSTCCYLAGKEVLPYRSTPKKRYISKVIFLAAVARPRNDKHRKSKFDEKIGIWPIVETTSEKSSSTNRTAVSLVLQNVTMTCEVYVHMLKEKVFPAIRKLWSGNC